MSSEVREDLGYVADKPSGKLIQDHAYRPSHESEEITAKRRGVCLEAIFRVFPKAQIFADGLVTAEIEGKKFDLYPSSNCWYSHAAKRFGYDIPKLMEQVERLLLKK